MLRPNSIDGKQYKINMKYVWRGLLVGFEYFLCVFLFMYINVCGLRLREINCS